MRLLLGLLTASTLFADWQEYRTGPFEIWTEAGDKEARQLLVRLEQLRHMLGTYLGKTDPVSMWTLRVLIRKNAQPGDWRLGRDAWISIVAAGRPPSQVWVRETARMLLESNARRMPPEWESGLLDFLSTIESAAPKVTIGNPPPNPNRNWARVHYLATDPEFGSRFRVLLNNLQQGALEEVAYRNSIGMTRPELDAAAEKHLTANPRPITIGGRAISDRDFPSRPIEPASRIPAALSDATGNRKLDAAGSLEAMESAGLDAARANRPSEALALLKQAVANESKSPFVHLEYGKAEKDPPEKLKAFVEAARKNARWPEPYIEMAKLETSPDRVAHYLKEAATRDPRNSALWQQLGRAQLEAGQFTDAAKSYFTAELAAPDEKERAVIRDARRRFDDERAAKEAAERKRLADERQAELERLKTAAMNRIREAEAKANKGQSPGAEQKVEQWWDDKTPARKISGTLERVECFDGPARLSIKQSSGKMIPLLIEDPKQVVITGGAARQAFGCGVQKPPKHATIEYRPRNDARFGTAGDVTIIEFR